MSKSTVVLAIPEEKVKIQRKVAFIDTGLTMDELILKLMFFASQDKPIMIVEKEEE